jgi:hypothetical protein
MKNSIMTDSELCSNAALERPRYFARQMLTQAELTLEQNYFRDRLRRHNRLLHGWGVVCGANICAIPNADQSGAEPWKVRVKPGYILGPYGDEIVIDCERVVDLRTAGVTGMAGETSAELGDPWCSEVFVDRREGPFYIAVKFKEVMTRPVRVQPIGCGCDDNQCEYSRWRDGYEIGILSECPDSHRDLQEETTRPSRSDVVVRGSANEAGATASPAAGTPSRSDEAGREEEEDEPPIYFKNGCPPCPSDPWVVLGVVQVDSDGTLMSIDNCACRRIAPTLALLARACHHQPIEIKNVKSDGLAVGAVDVPIEVEGVGFETGIRASLGSGVKVKQLKVEAEGTRLTFTADVSPQAVAGARTLTITNPDCSTITKEVTIAPATAAPPPPPQPAEPIKPGPEATPAAQPGAQPALNTGVAQPVIERAPARKGRRRGGGI